MDDFYVACVQSPPGGVVSSEYLGAVVSTADAQVDLVVIPELGTTPYFPLEEKSGGSVEATTLESAALAGYADVVRRHGCHVLMGLYVTGPGGPWNAAVMLGPDGVLVPGRSSSGASRPDYRKVHLCDIQEPGVVSFHESEYFVAGEDYLLWDLPFAAVGALICYDRHFPEAWRTLRGMGAELVAVPTTSPVGAAATFVAEAQAMALQQSVYVAMANRVGTDVLVGSGTRTEFLGSSCIVDPSGRLLAAAPPQEPVGLVSAQLTAGRLAEVRARNRFFEHLRPDSYRPP